MKKIFACILAWLGLCSSCGAQTPAQVSPEEFSKGLMADTVAVLLDVRTPDEFKAGHIKGALELDWLNAEKFASGLAKLSKEPVYYIYCRSGKRSAAAAAKMRAEGYRVVDLRGGFLGWQKAGYPVEK